MLDDPAEHGYFQVSLFDGKERQKAEIEENDDLDERLETNNEWNFRSQSVALLIHIVAETSPHYCLFLVMKLTAI